MKVLVFDMDGTIADFYNVDGWLDCLMAEDTRPYTEARPFYDMFAMMEVLNELKNDGWRVVVTTWLAKDANLIKQLGKQNWNGLKDSVFPMMNCTWLNTAQQKPIAQENQAVIRFSLMIMPK